MTHKPTETLYARRKTRSSAPAQTPQSQTDLLATGTSTSSSSSASESPLSSPDPTSPRQAQTLVKPRRRGHSLRTNVLLRPHLSTPSPSSPSPSPSISCPSTTATAAAATVTASDEGAAPRGRGVGFAPLARQEMDSAADTAYYGFVVLASTWVVFVVGMGSVLGVWEWCWDVPGSPFPSGLSEAGVVQDAFIPGYYPALVILTCVMAWVWVVVAWMGMKYFKHAKISGSDDG